jgi:hypothetical protein
MVIGLAIPAMAGVCVECSQVGDTNVVEVTYTMDTGDDNLPRAFALDVSLTVDNANDIAPYDFNPEYYVAPGTYTYNEATGEVNWGNPAVDATPNSVTIEMGSLYATNDPCHTTPPDPCGVLFRFTVDNDCDVVLEENAARAGVDSNGVVMEDTEQTYPPGYVDVNGCKVVRECFRVGQWIGGNMITQAMHDKWVEADSPDSWCYDCHWRSDTDGDCDVDYYDALEFIDGWDDWVNFPSCDTDNDGDVDYYDALNFLDGWDTEKGCNDPCAPEYPNQGQCTPLP